VVPNKIKQELGAEDSMLISVYLADLKNNGKVRMTHVKLGSSSFAYAPDQIGKLKELTKHLNEKNLRVATKLEQEGVIRSATADPLTRVALQAIKDFAKPIRVKTGAGEEDFYRWYLLGGEETETKVKKLLGTDKKEPEKKPEPVPEAKKEPKPVVKVEPTPKPVSKPTPKPQPAAKPVKKVGPAAKAEQKVLKTEAESEFGKIILQYQLFLCQLKSLQLILHCNYLWFDRIVHVASWLPSPPSDTQILNHSGRREQ